MSDSKFTVLGTIYVETTDDQIKYVCVISNDYADLEDDEKMRHLKAVRDMFKEKVKELKQAESTMLTLKQQLKELKQQLEDRDND